MRRWCVAVLVLGACEDDEPPRMDPTLVTIGSDPATTSEPTDDESSSEGGEASTDESSEGGSTGSDADYPHIARAQVPAAWLGRADGLWDAPFDGQSSPFHAIGQAFYAEHPDAWDFLVVYTEGELVGGYQALADTVAYDIEGIGLPPGDWVQPSDAGSAGRLQQINVMNTPQFYAYDPSDADVLVHETTHRWAAFIELPGTPQEAWLLDEGYAHWNVHVNTGGPSATGYGDVEDLGAGAFRYRRVWPLQLSQLELYLAGLIPAQEVGAMFWVSGPNAYDPATSTITGMPFDQHDYGEDVAYSGTRVDFAVADVIASNGARVPAYGDAPTHFRFAFVMVCHDVQACPEDDLQIVEGQRLGFVDDFAAATGGRASAEVSLQP